MDSLYLFPTDDNTPQKQCTACLKSFPAIPEYFGRAKNGRYGVRSMCKECEKSGKHPVKSPDGTKKCTKCERLFPATTEYFHYDRYGKNDLHARCKDCSYQKRPMTPLPPYACKIHGEVEPYIISYPSRGESKRREGLVRRICPICRDISEQKYAPKHREVSRQWLANNPTRVSDYQRRRRARKRGAPGTLTHQQTQDKLRLQRFRCYYCHLKFEKRNGRYMYHLDHVTPLARPEAGPRHDMSHTVLACPHCNTSKGDKLLCEWPQGGRLL